MTDYNIATGVRNFINFENYRSALFDVEHLRSIKTTFIFIIGTVALSTSIGLGLALILNKYSKGRSIFVPFLLMPMMLTPVVVGLMWGMMYNTDFGVIAFLLRTIGIKRGSWTGDPSTALLTVILTDVWQWTPFAMILLLSGLQAIPQEPFEAAQIDGASKWHMFRYITLPLLKPILLIVIVFRIVDSIKVFDVVYTLTAGGPGTTTEVISLFIYRTCFRFFRMGYASALSWILLIITVILCEIYIKLIRE